ncbi:hypothetical protein KVF89_18705 [Nocardioides carbamazepini]|uniref:hypothetical protein n=1 Tax=Nocardioides carbamazepini TaxID=2854259 RepID=UPI00214A84D3|nr:hypothetical protein [Nocardioides carbamazepini]MCR1784581.1 hypothetical protein [Nocardioides carbamazepini]
MNLTTTRANRRGVVRKVAAVLVANGPGDIRVLLAAFNADLDDLDDQLSPNSHTRGQSQP